MIWTIYKDNKRLYNIHNNIYIHQTKYIVYMNYNTL